MPAVKSWTVVVAVQMKVSLQQQEQEQQQEAVGQEVAPVLQPQVGAAAAAKGQL